MTERRSESPADSMDITLFKRKVYKNLAHLSLEIASRRRDDLPNSEQLSGGGSQSYVGSSVQVDGGL